MLSLQLQPTLCCNPINYSFPGSSVHRILQAWIQEWVAIPFSRGSSQPRGQTQVSCVAGRFFTIWATREAWREDKKLKRLLCVDGVCRTQARGTSTTLCPNQSIEQRRQHWSCQSSWFWKNQGNLESPFPATGVLWQLPVAVISPLLNPSPLWNSLGY